MTLVAGVDGGGTSTRVVLLRGDGVVLGEGCSGTGNLHDVGPEVLRDHIRAAWLAAWEQASEAPRSLDAVSLCMASVGNAPDREVVRSLAAELGLAERIAVDIDLVGSLAGGLAGRPGIAVIAGTGSSCYGRGPDGAEWQSGGWGSLLDDRGGAHDLGRGALAACALAFDGRGAPTRLMDSVQARLELEEWRDLLPRVDAVGMGRTEIAELAPLVTEAARAGDLVALDLIERGTEHLGRAVEAVARRIGLSAPLVVATGGLAQSELGWRLAFERAVLRRVPDATIVEPALSPVLGAALVALRAAGAELDAEALDRLVQARRPRTVSWGSPTHGPWAAHDPASLQPEASLVGFDQLAERCEGARSVRIGGAAGVFGEDFVQGLRAALARRGRVLARDADVAAPAGGVRVGLVAEPCALHDPGGDVRIWLTVNEEARLARRDSEARELCWDDSRARAQDAHLTCDVGRPGQPHVTRPVA